MFYFLKRLQRGREWGMRTACDIHVERLQSAPHNNTVQYGAENNNAVNCIDKQMKVIWCDMIQTDSARTRSKYVLNRASEHICSYCCSFPATFISYSWSAVKPPSSLIAYDHDMKYVSIKETNKIQKTSWPNNAKQLDMVCSNEVCSINMSNKSQRKTDEQQSSI